MNRQSHHTPTLTRKEARSQLACLLAGARPERLAGFTVEGLSAINATPRKEIAEMLERARQGRLV